MLPLNVRDSLEDKSMLFTHFYLMEGKKNRNIYSKQETKGQKNTLW